MKKLIAILLSCAGFAFADGTGTVHKSSFTKTNDTAYIRAGSIQGVIIASTSIGGFITLYNSTYTTNAPVISSVTMGTLGQYQFYDSAVVGIYYVTVSNSSGVTIIYKN